MGKDLELQSSVLRVATLFDEAFIVSDEKRGSAEEHTAEGRLMISAIPLQDMGIAQIHPP